MKNLRQKKWFRVLSWNVFNALITGAIAYFTDVPTELSPAILIALNIITKYVNTTYFGDLGTPSPSHPHQMP